MNCFMFPGQPLSHADNPTEDDDVREITALVMDRAGLDLPSFAWKGIEYSEHVGLQVYGVAMSLIENRRLRRLGAQPSIIAEHSMGIYPAMASCGALPEGEAVEITLRIGACLAAMGDRGDYALGCITGLPVSPLMAIAENNAIYIANYNTSRHFLLSGERRNVEEAVAEALAQGAFSAKTFPCDAPLHTPLLEEKGAGLAEIVRDYRFKEPSMPLMSHIDQDFLTAVDLPDFLVRELCLPVQWEQTFRALCSAGVTRFVEVGAGDSLKKYNRWITSESQ